MSMPYKSFKHDWSLNEALYVIVNFLVMSKRVELLYEKHGKFKKMILLRKKLLRKSSKKLS
jgi:hypothetical protein